jgi:hypothetical protein
VPALGEHEVEVAVAVEITFAECSEVVSRRTTVLKCLGSGVWTAAVATPSPIATQRRGRGMRRRLTRPALPRVLPAADT